MFPILQKYRYNTAAAHTALILNGPDPIGIGVTYSALMAFSLMPCHRDGSPPIPPKCCHCRPMVAIALLVDVHEHVRRCR